MKFSKSKLLLTVLSPLVLSLSWTNTANAGSGRYNLGNGGYINIICNINPDKSKVVATQGNLGKIASSNLSLHSGKKTIKKKLPVDQNGYLDFTKNIVRKNVSSVTLKGSVWHSGMVEWIYKKVTCS